MKKFASVFIWIAFVYAFQAGQMGYSESEHKEHTAAPAASGPNVRDFTQVALEYEGSKLWLPGNLLVKKGDKVRIKLINNIKSEPNTHGFAIDEFGIKLIVERGKPQTVEFIADKEGLYTIYCQIHPAHIGGQILVLP